MGHSWHLQLCPKPHRMEEPGLGEPCTQLELREIQMAAVLEGGNCDGVGVVKHFTSDSPFSALSDIGL